MPVPPGETAMSSFEAEQSLNIAHASTFERYQNLALLPD